MARDININAVCAHCGELLDTNEASRDDVVGGTLDLQGIDLYVGDHACFLEDATYDNGEPCPECGLSEAHTVDCPNYEDVE